MANFKIHKRKNNHNFYKSKREILEMCFESQYFCDGSILRRRLLCAVLPSLSARMCLLLSLFRVRREILAPAVTLHSTLTVNCMEFARSEVQ